MEKPCPALNIADIIETNRRLTESSGGRHGVMNPGSLEHMLEEVQGFMFGQPLYPTTMQKAAFLCMRIARGHFFFDGNKRTSFCVCLSFLEWNGLFPSIDEEEVKSNMVAIAEGGMALEDVESWLVKMLPADLTDEDSPANRERTVKSSP